jgi:cardiolipin synthase
VTVFNEPFDQSQLGLILLPLHLAIAAFVTAHALLNKREVGSALGWIGLVLFSPFLGGALYFVFGINRVRRRARRLAKRPRVRKSRISAAELPEDLKPLQRSIAQITKRPLETGTCVDTYQDGDEAYPEMLAAIEEAKASIGLTSYIFRKDKSGTQFIEALKAAHERGVAVRVIVDGLGSGWVRSPAYAALQKAAIPVGRFLHSPWPWRMPLMNLRSHKKIMIVDGRIGFTGGMNIADENVMAMNPREPVQDTHFKITGPVVAQLVDAFADDWAFVTQEDLSGEAWFPALSPDGDGSARVITSGPDQDIEKIETSIIQAITCARASIYVMTPYFLPDERIMIALSLAAMRGVAVHVVMPEHSNHWYVDRAARANIGPILRDGVHVWLGPEPFRHSKLMVVDGEWSLIGSANWDVRSLRLNFELCMEVYDEHLAQSLQNFVTRHRGKPLTLKELKARSLSVRLGDAALRLLMPYL